ncbi:unnamed protein product [Closterium sp. NIES-64]|nr:unnamed protein product [Closterium sp. NIES-64]
MCHCTAPLSTCQGHLHTYRFCESLWTFILTDAVFQTDGEVQMVDRMGTAVFADCEVQMVDRVTWRPTPSSSSDSRVVAMCMLGEWVRCGAVQMGAAVFVMHGVDGEVEMVDRVKIVAADSKLIVQMVDRVKIEAADAKLIFE